MRVLVTHPGPHFAVADVYRGVVKGLRENGCEVVDFNLDDRLDFYVQALLEKNGEVRRAFDYESACRLASKGLEAVLYEWWPDMVIIMSGFFLPPELYRIARVRGHHLVLWCTESPYEDERQIQQAPFVDTVVLNDPTNIDEFKEHNPRTVYVPHSYDAAIHRPGRADPELVCDFGFVGTGYPSRMELLDKVDWSGIDVKLGGNWQHLPDDSPLRGFLVHEIRHCMDNTVAVDLYRSAKMSANLYRKEAMLDDDIDGWAMSPREVELAATGCFFAREPRVEGDQLLPMLPTFSDAGELEDLIRWWTSHDGKREEVAREARAAVAERTFQAHTARLLQLITD